MLILTVIKGEGKQQESNRTSCNLERNTKAYIAAVVMLEFLTLDYGMKLRVIYLISFIYARLKSKTESCTLKHVHNNI